MLLIYLVSANVPEPIVLSQEHDNAEWVPIETAKKISVQLANIDWDRIGKVRVNE
jgi:hypothetical protein